MPSYHFNIGDSTTGPIGLCARVTAPTKEEALKLLLASLPDEQEVGITKRGIEYINVYFNEAAITIDDIDEEDDDE